MILLGELQPVYYLFENGRFYMAANSSALSLKKANVVAQDTPKKVRTLIAKTSYEAPKVISFPVDGIKGFGAISLSGNI
jgi:hypothetical protein